jgi:isopenicillin-N epimerase
MLSPKGAGFLHARRQVQDMLEPLVVSWGWHSDEHFTTGSTFVDAFQWRGTYDPSASLAVPAAIRFMQEHGWEGIRHECHALLAQVLERIQTLTGLPGIYLELPLQPDLRSFKSKLYNEHRIEVPCIEWQGCHWLRVSVQGYNDQDDIDCLVEALERLL